MPVGVAVPVEALATLRRRLVALPARHPERGVLMKSTAQLYAVSRATLYRLLRGDRRPKDTHRADRGRPRSMPAPEIERWCEIVAAMKIRTTNKKGRHLSTVRTLQLLVEHGVDTPDGFEPAFPGCGGISVTLDADSGRDFRAIDAAERAQYGRRDG